MVKYILLVSLLLLAGCSMFQPSTPFQHPANWSTIQQLPEASSPLGVLNWTAGLAIIGGLVATVLGLKGAGIRCVVGGVILIIISYAIGAYSHILIVPVGIFLTVVSALWGYQTMIKAWRTRK